jgi:hypothetical protein
LASLAFLPPSWARQAIPGRQDPGHVLAIVQQPLEFADLSDRLLADADLAQLRARAAAVAERERLLAQVERDAATLAMLTTATQAVEARADPMPPRRRPRAASALAETRSPASPPRSQGPARPASSRHRPDRPLPVSAPVPPGGSNGVTRAPEAASGRRSGRRRWACRSSAR